MENDLTDEKALKKLKELADDIKVCMFITNNEQDDDQTRPMTTVDIEDDGTLWFFTNRASQKVDEVNKEQRVHLVYADPGKENYLDVWGKAETTTDKAIIKEKWSPIIKAWFPGGVDDPNIALLKVKPQSAYYWDTKSGKMVAFLKMAISAVTGHRVDEGEKGQLKI